MTAAHAPRYLYWIQGRAYAGCTCHLGQPVPFDRPLPAKPTAGAR